MRWAVTFVALVAGVSAGCAGNLAAQTNSAKLGEAAAFAAAAGIAELAESAIERHARNSAPVTHAGGVAVTRNCDNEGQYPCVTVSPSESEPPVPEPDMDSEEARDYVVGYINGVRKLNSASPLVRDSAVDAFAQDGSEQLSTEHKSNQHMAEHAQDLGGKLGEVQGSPDGARPGPLQDQIADILLNMMREGAGGMHHDVLLSAEWRKLGVGIVQRAGRTYFTVDFSR